MTPSIGKGREKVAQAMTFTVYWFSPSFFATSERMNTDLLFHFYPEQGKGKKKNFWRANGLRWR
jgi:hypothetical protein